MAEERIIAKKLRKEENFKEALVIYKKLWRTCNKDNMDIWLGWEYADTLKKFNMIDDAISVCKQIYLFKKDFKYNNDLLSWCLYQKFFKNLDTKEKHINLGQIESIASFIINNTQQEAKLPYEKTVWKVIKLFKDPFDVSKIGLWIDKLNVDLLDDKSVCVTVNNRNIELASNKEQWYYLKCKVASELGQFKECINWCDAAMLNIKKFHNDRDIWMQARKAECISFLGDPESAINLLEQLLCKKEHWTIHKTIFQMKIDLKCYDEGLGHAFIAALTKDPPDKKINLYFKIGQVLERKKEYKYALMHYVFVKKIREEKKWSIPSELIQCIDRLRVEDEIKTDNIHMQLRDYWVSQKIFMTKRFEGFIMRLLPNGKAGFIKVENNSYYFRIISILSLKKNVFEGVKVSFSLVDSFDSKKGKSTKEAVDILFTEGKEDNNG